VCFIGISQEAYRAAVREGADISWYCVSCLGDPVAESTRDGDSSADILGSEEFNPPVESSEDHFDESTVQSTVAESVITEPETSVSTVQSTVAESVITEPETSVSTVQSTVAESVTTEPETSVSDPPVEPTIDESAIEGPTPQPVVTENQPLTFKIVEGASERGKRKLIDSWGFIVLQCRIAPKKK